MRLTAFHFVSAGAVVMLSAGCGRGNHGRRPLRPVTLTTCLEEMTNIAAIASAPAGRVYMASSHDPTGGNCDWRDMRSLNPDGSMDVLNVEGPGCVRRVWMTSQSPAEWAFFIDGEETPRLTGVCRGEGVSSNSPRLLFREPLCGNVSGGHYSYIPIPFERSLRIVAQDGFLTSIVKKPYYHVNYSIFPKGSAVESFPRELSEAELATLDRVVDTMSRKEEVLAAAAESCAKTNRLEVAPGASAVWLDEQNAGVLRCIWMSVRAGQGTGQDELDRLLRDVSLEMTWDNAAAPSVNVPLGDFFFCSFAARPFSSWYVGRVGERFICRWPMPFAQKAVGRIRNSSARSIVCEYGVDIGQPASDGEVNYLHAEWRVTESQDRPANRPHRVASIEGRGHYVGTYMSVRGTDGGWSILEGDDRVRVDGEEEPSLHGTGLEDYFDGAWYYRELADAPYSGLLDKAAMWTSQYRLHVLDRVPFSRGYDFEFEFGHKPSSKEPPNTAQGYMSTVAFWYGAVPCEVLALPDGTARFPRATRYDPYMIMANLLELEAEGLHEVAWRRCVAYGERFADTEAGGVISLRGCVYQALLGDRDGALATCRELVGGARFDSVKALGGYLVQELTTTNVAMVCVQSTCPFTVYLDGRKLGDGQASPHCLGFRVNLSPGHHELGLELNRARGDQWVLAEVRNADGVLTTDAAWEGSRAKPDAWPQAGSKAPSWQAVRKAGTRLPTMGMFLLPPNPYVDVQSGVKFIRPFGVLDKANTAQTVYLRRSFQAGK